VSCPPHPHTLPASSPPLARPSFRVLIDRVSFVRPASSSILPLNHPATTTLHTRTPPFACTLRPPPPCVSSTLPISAPRSFHHHLHLTPLASAFCLRNRSPLPATSPPPSPPLPAHISLARARAVTLPRVLSLSLALSLSLPPRLGGVRGWGRRASIPSALCCAWFVWLGKAGRYPLRPGAFSPFLGFLLPPLTLHPAYLTKSSTVVSQGAYR